MKMQLVAVWRVLLILQEYCKVQPHICCGYIWQSLRCNLSLSKQHASFRLCCQQWQKFCIISPGLHLAAVNLCCNFNLQLVASLLTNVFSQGKNIFARLSSRQKRYKIGSSRFRSVCITSKVATGHLLFSQPLKGIDH